MAPVYLFCFVLFSHILLIFSAGHENGHQDTCPRSFTCGNRGSFQYPFTKAELPDCGLLPIHCCDNDYYSVKMIQLEKNGRIVELTGVAEQNKIITIHDEDFRARLDRNTCATLNNSYSLPPPSPLASINIKCKVTLFRCNHHLKFKPPAHYVQRKCHGYDIYYDKNNTSPNKEDAGRTFSDCSVVQFSTKDETNTTDILSFVSSEIVLEVVLSQDCYDCYNNRGGQCRLDADNKFYCDKAPTAPGKKKTRKTVLIMATAVSSVVAVLLLLACCSRRKLFPLTICWFWNKDLPTDERIIERFLKQHGSLPTRRYNYSEIKKATNCFKVKLGQGGYGSVYKGKLQDGLLVAVKVLSELKGTEEEFINEVASISRTSHVNIVTLVGFCFQGSKRALVYEFMPNGSLEKFIYKENSMIVGWQLDCKTLHDIAVGVAHGLDYLHRGCNTRILHFDIKPHNILLDKDFCPKISDFGLAKICPRKESIVSMMCARGTIGYIAPEVFSRNFGGVSYKADVYSYGMMVLEMVGGRDNKNVQVDCSSELYFPHWIYKRLELNQDFGLLCIKNESDRETVRKMIVMSLWCIQTNPLSRPSMSKVVEMLEGSLESLELPPKPFLHSSPTSPTHYSTQTSETL